MAIEYRLGRAEEYDDYIDFVNYVFGFNGTSSNFQTLIPYFYRRERNPAEPNYVALEDGKIKAAVGFFRHDLRVCGETLRCTGIGSVAVHPFCRGKGYMKALMKMTTDDMLAQNIDMGIVGGWRHRYQHFGYERAGTAIMFRITDAAMRQSFGDRSSTLTAYEVQASDTEILDRIAADIERQPVVAVRQRAALHEILTGRSYRLFAMLKDGEYRGYAVTDKDHIKELVLTDPAAEMDDFLIAIYRKLGFSSLNFRLAPHQRAYISALIPRFDTYSLDATRMFSIFHYRRVINAYLKLKLTYTSLPDGELCLHIHGAAREECLRIRIENGTPSVQKCTPEECTLELDHIPAMQLLFAPFCPARDPLPYFARLWFPLPIWLFPSDHF